MSICSTQSSLFRWRWTSMISQKHVWPLTLCSASLCRVVADCNDRHWSVIAQKGASKGQVWTTAAAAAKLRNTWRHQPLLQYCLYLLLLLLAAVAVRLLWACCCRCYCHCCCSAAAPLESFPRPVVENHLPAGKHHASQGRASSKTAPKNSLTRRLKS